MNDHSVELPSRTEQPRKAQHIENLKPTQESFKPKVEESAWERLKKAKTNIAGGLTLAFYLASANVGEAKRDEYVPPPIDNKPAAELVVQQEDFAGKMSRMESLYAASYSNKSLQSHYDLYKLLGDIRSSPEFKNLGPSAKAEVLHREGYSLLTANKEWFFKNYKKTTQEFTKDYLENYSGIYNLFKESIETTKEISPEQERTINALMETAKVMAQQAVMMKAERPDLSGVAERLQENIKDPLELAFSLDPRMRYIGTGIFVFPETEKQKAISSIIGIEKFNRIIQTDVSDEHIIEETGGAIFGVKKFVVPWANAVKNGEFSATPSERSFIDTMSRLGILKLEGGQYSTTEIANIVLTESDPTKFTHEIAHMVALSIPKYLKKAESDYQRLSVSDRESFDTFIKKENPNASKQKIIEEFFAYSNQRGGWRNWILK